MIWAISRPPSGGEQPADCENEAADEKEAEPAGRCEDEGRRLVIMMFSMQSRMNFRSHSWNWFWIQVLAGRWRF